MVCALARRRPWKVARETASLDRLSGGRLVFGAGLGSAGEREFAAFGEDPDPRHRAELLDEGLEVLTGLWSGEPFAHRGRALHRPRGRAFARRRCSAADPGLDRRPLARPDGRFAAPPAGTASSPPTAMSATNETMTPGQLAEIVAYTRSFRDAARRRST